MDPEKSRAVGGSDKYPLSSKAALSNTFVDDVVISPDTLQEALTLCDQLLDPLSSEGFVLKKWTGSSTALIKGFPPEHVGSNCPKSVLSLA